MAAAYSHWSQGYLISSCFDSLCCLNLINVEAAYSHRYQGYLFNSCVHFFCCLKLLNMEAEYSHWSQGYLIFVFWLFLLFQINEYVSSICTLITGISDTFMYRFSVFIKSISWSCRFTLIPSCLDFICFFKSVSIVAEYYHWSQGSIIHLLGVVPDTYLAGNSTTGYPSNNLPDTG